MPSQIGCIVTVVRVLAGPHKCARGAVHHRHAVADHPGFPHARPFLFGENGIEETRYEDTEHYQVTRDFLQNPEVYLKHLVG